MRSLYRGGITYDESFYNIKEHDYENKSNNILPNSELDNFLINITRSIELGSKTKDTVEIRTILDEVGKEEYISNIDNNEYNVMPIYDYVDSRRVNVDCKEFERDFVKIKLYDILKTESKFKCAYGKYPNGKIALSLLENTKRENEIDECISYLTDFRKDLIIENIPEEYKQKLKILFTIDNNQYLELFENMMISDSYIEPQKFMEEVLQRKYKVQEMIKDRNLNLESKEVISTLELGIQANKAIKDVELSDEYENVIIRQEKEILSVKDSFDIGENNG